MYLITFLYQKRLYIETVKASDEQEAIEWILLDYPTAHITNVEKIIIHDEKANDLEMREIDAGYSIEK